MAFKMKNPSMGKMAKTAGDSRAAMKLKGKSPMEKELVGKQGNLPPELKAKIEAAPAKMRNRKGAMETEAPLKMKSAMKKDKEAVGGTTLPEVRITGKKEKEEDYNPDGTINKNSKRYKDAVAAAKRKKEREAKRKALNKKRKSGVDLSYSERTQVAGAEKL